MKKLVTTVFALVALWYVPCLAAEKKATSSPSAIIVGENEELARIFTEDQKDREPKDGKSIDWAVVGPRDKARQKRVMQLYTAGELNTGRDYFHAAMIFQHGEKPEDYLLCHELCVAAVFKSGGSETWLSSAKWLAAASHDRFLLSIGRGQRFGTQFSSDGPSSPWRLDMIDEGVSDELRKAWNVPPLAEAKRREAAMNKKRQ